MFNKLKTKIMKKLKITLLLIAFAFFGQLAVAQVLITDDPATNTSANPNHFFYH